MSGSLIVSSALRRAVLSCNVARSACAPAVANFKNVNQIKISSNILSRNFMSSGISSNEEDRDYVAFVPKKVFKMTPVADKSIYSRSSIFIGNLDFTVTEQGIMERLEEVLGPDIALRARIAVDRDTGRSKGFAHVDFANDDHAAEAVVELRDIELLGRILRVDHAAKKSDSMNRNAAPPVSMTRPPMKRPLGSGPVHSVFIGNLSWDVTPELVEDMLTDVIGPGLFTQVRLAIDRETGRQRGFGHIDFTTEEAAARAVKELNGLEVMGREMRADFAVKKDNSFSRPRDGAGDW